MDYYREYKNSDAFHAYKDILEKYIDNLEPVHKMCLFNDLMRELNDEPIYSMDELNDLMSGLSFTDALNQIDVDMFNLTDDYVRDTIYGWQSSDDLDTLGGSEYESDIMSEELLCLDISKYTEIQDKFILTIIAECEREAAHETKVREELKQQLKHETEKSVLDDAEIVLRG